ncbi:Asp-tRNA(Asn)/Glu-tRNA(Gln) amidotransferase subunit GatC [Candidatus Saccharibacteria bacterium]|jgi:aspartyl-tRNA(Asn)/glutamyl-tRNA(Gln) amidotransferase subunit C|nr:MAG: Asp-tRNA(Asn)/Glu-tRNA(Gln) amidotransferase subunit GatC [Candidatus Saccharibacteria bacterium]
MSKLTLDEVFHLAKLARLKLSEDEALHFKDELSAILSYVEMLNNVDVGDLMPTYQVTGLQNVTRPDVVDTNQTLKADLFKNLPATQDDQIKVKRMIV